MKEKKLEKRIGRLEKLLRDLVLRNDRCKYIYQVDLRAALIKRKIYNEKELRRVPWATKKIKWHTPKKEARKIIKTIEENKGGEQQ